MELILNNLSNLFPALSYHRTIKESIQVSKVIIFIAILCLQANAVEVGISKNSQAILIEMDQEIGEARLKAKNSLEKELKDLTKRGDLDGANAVKNKVDEIESLLNEKEDERNFREIAKSLVGRSFGFYNSKGLLGKITLEESGKIGGSKNDNETSWKMDLKANTVYFLKNDGVPSTAFTHFRREEGKIIMTGKFLLLDGYVHVLKEL